MKLTLILVVAFASLTWSRPQSTGEGTAITATSDNSIISQFGSAVAVAQAQQIATMIYFAEIGKNMILKGINLHAEGRNNMIENVLTFAQSLGIYGTEQLKKAIEGIFDQLKSSTLTGSSSPLSTLSKQQAALFEVLFSLGSNLFANVAKAGALGIGTAANAASLGINLINDGLGIASVLGGNLVGAVRGTVKGTADIAKAIGDFATSTVPKTIDDARTAANAVTAEINAALLKLRAGVGARFG